MKPKEQPPLRIDLSVQTGVEHGETIHLELHCGRFAKDELRLRSRPAHDFIITTEAGREIWRWSQGKRIEDKMYAFTQQEVLLAGEWDQRDSEGRLVLPGSYWVRGLLNLEQQQVITRRTRLVIFQGPELKVRLHIPSLGTSPNEPLPYWTLGQKLPLKLTLQNLSDHSVSIAFKSNHTYDFAVTTTDGTEVWRWSDRATIEAFGQQILQAGEVLEFAAEWDQRDNQGRPIISDQYRIKGILYLDQNTQEQESKIFIGAGLPLQLALQIPAEVENSEAIVLQFKIQNISVKTLDLKIGTVPYDFVVITADNQEVWRWTYGKAFPLPLLHLTLRQGESKEYSVTWDQVDNEGYPVSPGTYWVKGILRAAAQENLFEINQSNLQQFVIKP